MNVHPKRFWKASSFATGAREVTFVDGDLWHATWEADESELRRVAKDSGAVLETLKMPPGMHVSGLEADGAGLFYCGGGGTAKVRAVRRPRRR